MKLFFVGVAVLVLSAAAACPARGQVEQTSVQRGLPSRAAGPAQTLRWVHREDTPDQVFLFQGQRQIGGYSYASGFYLPFDGQQWHAPARSPITPPFEAGGLPSQRVFFGANRDKLAGHNRYFVAGHEAPKSEVDSYLDGSVPRDAHAPHVTAFTLDKPTKKKLDADWLAAAASDGSLAKVRWQAYDASAPVNRLILAPFKLDQDRAFQTSRTMIASQFAQKDKQDFVPAARSYSYAGPKDLIDAVRKIDPLYDPNKSPLPSLPTLGNLPPEVWFAVVVVGVGLFFVARKRS